MLWTMMDKKHLERAVLKESTKDFTNPGRGWYHIYTFRLGKPDAQQLRWQPYYEKETLALVRMDLRDFKEKLLDETALQYAEEILDTFADNGKDVILRACYDTEGNGLLREPSSFSLVLRHLRQVGALVRKHAAQIYVVQGLLVGSWGEMHSSRFLDPLQLQRMGEVWKAAAGEEIPLAVRKPCFMRMLPQVRRIGLYDDALCSTETHMGTFGEKRQSDTVWEDAWCPKEEIAFLSEQIGRVPCGGEALSGEDYSVQEILTQMKEMQVSYLNSVYDPIRLQEWKGKKLSGDLNLYDVISEHLGYRFVVKKVAWKKGILSATIVNGGFAAVCFEVRVIFVCGEEKVEVPCDLRRLRPGKSVEISSEVTGCGAVSMKLERKNDAHNIRLANVGAGETLCLGRLVER